MGMELILVFVCIAIALLSAVVGGTIIWVSQKSLDKKRRIDYERMGAAMLYYDLGDIQDYLAEESTLDGQHLHRYVDIRYSSDWQNMLARCAFLKPDDIKHLYKIYNTAYDFDLYVQHALLRGENDITNHPPFRQLVTLFYEENEISEKHFVPMPNTKLNAKYEEIVNKLIAAMASKS